MHSCDRACGWIAYLSSYRLVCSGVSVSGLVPCSVKQVRRAHDGHDARLLASPLLPMRRRMSGIGSRKQRIIAALVSLLENPDAPCPSSSTARADELRHSPPQWGQRLGDASRDSRIEDDRPSDVRFHNGRERDRCGLLGNVADGGFRNQIEPYHRIAEALSSPIFGWLLLFVGRAMSVMLMPFVGHRVRVAAQGTGICGGKSECGTFQCSAQQGKSH